MLQPILAVLFQGDVPPATQPTGGGATGPAGQAPSATDSLLNGFLIPLALCGLVFYFIVIRPDGKRRKQREALLANLKKGDRVVLGSGLYGSVVQVQDQVVTLQVAEGVRMRYAVSAIQTVLEGEEGAETTVPAKTT
jgi:preprotein translocase subunit YajC